MEASGSEAYLENSQKQTSQRMGQITGVRGILPAENRGFKARLEELAGWETMEVEKRGKKNPNFSVK